MRIIIILFFFAFTGHLVCSMPLELINSFEVDRYNNAKKLYDYALLELSEKKIIEVLEHLEENPAGDKALLLETEIDLIQGNYKIAETKLLKFIRNRNNSPFLPFSYYRIATLRFKQDDFDLASKYFFEAFESSKENYSIRHKTNSRMPLEEYYEIGHHSLYWLSVAQAQYNNISDAEFNFAKLSELYPKGEFTDDALYAQGQLKEQRKEHSDAIALFKKVRLEFPYSNVYLASLVREANNNLFLRNPAQAILVLERAEFAQKSISKMDSIGLLYEAQTHIENPQESIMYLRGEAGNIASNYEQAIIYFEAFLDTFVSSELENECLLGAGWAHLNLENYDKSLEYFDIIILNAEEKHWKVKSIAQLYRAVTLTRSGATDKAKGEFQALSLKGDYPFLGSVFLELGQIYYLENDLINAKKYLERANREVYSQNISVRIWLLLAATNMQLGNWQGAADAYEKAEGLVANASKIEMPKLEWYLSEIRLKKGISLVMLEKSGQAISSLTAYLAEAKKDDKKIEEALFWLAEAYYRSDMLNNAAQSYERILKQYTYPERKEEILYSLGWSYFRMRNFRKSSEVFDRMITEYPKTKYAVEVLIRQADAHHLNKNYLKAAQVYKRAVDFDSKNEEAPYAAFQRADALYRAGRYDEAISAAQDFSVRFGKSKMAPNAMYLVGWIRFQQRRYQEAIANFNYLIERYPNSGYVPRTYYAIADCYYNNGQFEEALVAYKRVIDNFPNSNIAPEAMRGVQQSLVLMGRDDEAIEVINDYTEKNSDSPFVRGFKTDGARILFDGKKYGAAIDEYEKIIQADPNNPENAEALYWMGKSYINMDLPEEAGKAFVKVQSKFPDSKYAALSMLEHALLMKKIANIEKSDSLFASLLNLYPNTDVAPQAGFERALIKFSLRDTSFALNLYEFVADNYVATEYADESRYRLANYHRRNNKNDTSRYHFLRLAQTTRSTDFAAESFYRIGELWKSDSQLDSAIAAYLEVRENFSENEYWFSLSLLSLGEIYENTKEYPKAEEVYSVLIQLNPDDEVGTTAKSRLKRVRRAMDND